MPRQDLNRIKVVLVEQKKTGKWLAEQLLVFPQGEHDDLPDALASAVELAGKTRHRSYFLKPIGF